MLHAMATAPKDGSVIILVQPDFLGLVFAFWSKEEAGWIAAYDITKGSGSPSDNYAGWMVVPGGLEALVEAAMESK